MGNLLLFLTVLASVLAIRTGTPYDDAVRTVGREPTFSYTACVNRPDTVFRYSKPMKFGVYGWDLDTAWYGMQTTNDTVVLFHKFGDRSEYKEYVTPPSEMKKQPNQSPKHKEMENEDLKNGAGAFLESLKRNNKQIREDRAAAIGEDAEMIYKRKIEDMEVSIRRMERDRENMLDLSPDSATSLKLASKFNPIEYADNDVELGVKIRNESIRLNISKKRYNYLFGHRYEIKEAE